MKAVYLLSMCSRNSTKMGYGGWMSNGGIVITFLKSLVVLLSIVELALLYLTLDIGHIWLFDAIPATIQ